MRVGVSALDIEGDLMSAKHVNICHDPTVAAAPAPGWSEPVVYLLGPVQANNQREPVLGKKIHVVAVTLPPEAYPV